MDKRCKLPVNCLLFSSWRVTDTTPRKATRGARLRRNSGICDSTKCQLASMGQVLQLATVNFFAENSACALHTLPIVFIGNAATHAHLVMLAIAVNSRPGIAMSAGVSADLIQEVQAVT